MAGCEHLWVKKKTKVKWTCKLCELESEYVDSRIIGRVDVEDEDTWNYLAKGYRISMSNSIWKKGKEGGREINS